MRRFRRCELALIDYKAGIDLEQIAHEHGYATLGHVAAAIVGAKKRADGRMDLLDAITKRREELTGNV